MLLVRTGCWYVAWRPLFLPEAAAGMVDLTKYRGQSRNRHGEDVYCVTGDTVFIALQSKYAIDTNQTQAETATIASSSNLGAKHNLFTAKGLIWRTFFVVL